MKQVNNAKKGKKVDNYQYKDWDQYARIKQIMINKRIQAFAHIAFDIEEEPSHVCAAIWGIPGRRNKRIEQKIAAYLGVSWESLFGEVKATA